MIRVFADQRADAVLVRKVVLGLLQVQHDSCAALRAVRSVETVNSPSPRDSQCTPVAAAAPGAARVHLDPIGDDERGIEADAELADQLRVLLLIAGQPRQELRGAGFGDGAEVLDRLLAAHADAVVGDRDRVRLVVELDRDGDVGVAFEQLRPGQCLEAQLVEGIRRVRDQLTQENFLVAVQEWIISLSSCLTSAWKSHCLRGGRVAHRVTPARCCHAIARNDSEQQ